MTNITLFDPKDAMANLEARQALANIARDAYGASAADVYADLIRLKGVTVDVFDPAFILPNLRQVHTGDVLIMVMAELAPPSLSRNRRLQIRFMITGTDWSLEAALLFEADAKSKIWLSLAPPAGTCSHRRTAQNRLKELTSRNLAFTPVR